MIKVTCAIIEKDGKVLVTQRSEKMNQPLKWEFPGGKIENGETAEECLKREIKEELNIEIKVGSLLPENIHDYGTFQICLIPFRAEYISGEINLLEHKTFLWLTKEELPKLDWAPADVPIVESCLRLL